MCVRKVVFGMSILENVGKKISGAGKAAIKASGDLVQVTKLNLEIKSEENKIEALMLEMGNAVYEKYKDGSPVDAELSIKCDEVTKCMDSIEELKAKIAEVKNLKKCSGCASEVDKDDTFCCKCGTKLDP